MTNPEVPGGDAVAAVIDEHDDAADSAVGDLTDNESLHSIASSIFRHQPENGRTYHSLNAGKYLYPNDEREQSRYGVQHNLWVVTLDGMLYRSPGGRRAKRVLDMGTGIGSWAIEFAESHPSAEVIGVDLSPIQCTMTPPNCNFEIFDLENEWTWSAPFDFIMCRAMNGSFTDIPGMLQKIYDNLTPGGYLEIQDVVFPVVSSDSSSSDGSNSSDYTSSSEDDDANPVADDSATRWFHQAIFEASVAGGRPLDAMSEFTETMDRIGFVGFKTERYVWPFNAEWPEDPKMQQMGDYHAINMDLGLEALSLALLTRVRGWSMENVLMLCDDVRREIRNPEGRGF